MPAQSTHAFAEKVALIADGTTPIGKAVALQLALCGAFVIVAHPACDKELRVIEELKNLGTLAESAPYSGPGIVGSREIASRVEGIYGRLDLLVTCAFDDTYVAYTDTNEDHFAKSMEKVVQSAFFTIKECLRLMNDRPKPRIVNIFSACDSVYGKKDLVVRSANAAVEAFTVSLSEDLGSKYGVNGICVSEAESIDSGGARLDRELFRAANGIDPDDVARAALFLLSSEAIGLRGQILRIGRQSSGS